MLPVGVAPHAQQPGQSLKEEALDPGSHGVVSGGGAVVDVDDKDGDDDGEGDKDHDEEQIFSDQRDHLETEQKQHSAEQFHFKSPKKMCFLSAVTQQSFKRCEDVESHPLHQIFSSSLIAR